MTTANVYLHLLPRFAVASDEIFALSKAAFAFDYFSGNRVTQKIVDFGGDANHDADTGIFDKQFTVAAFFSSNSIKNDDNVQASR